MDIEVLKEEGNMVYPIQRSNWDNLLKTFNFYSFKAGTHFQGLYTLEWYTLEPQRLLETEKTETKTFHVSIIANQLKVVRCVKLILIQYEYKIKQCIFCLQYTCEQKPFQCLFQCCWHQCITNI